jgi:hypothetical protein
MSARKFDFSGAAGNRTVGIFSIAGMRDGGAQWLGKMLVLEYYLARVHILHGAERHGELATVFDIHHELGRSLVDGANRTDDVVAVTDYDDVVGLD